MRTRNLVVLAVVALLACIASSPASASVLWEDDFTGGPLDSAKWTTTGSGTATVAGGNLTLNVAAGDWAYSQIDSVSTWTASTDLYYSFKIGGLPAGNFNIFQVFEGTAQTGMVAMRNDVVAGWLFDVRQGIAGTPAYQGTVAQTLSVGDVFTLKVGPTGSAAYKNGVMFDSSSVAPLGMLMVDAQCWREPGQSATQVFDYIRVSNTAPVPEPATLVLVATALFGLLCYAWRKRK